MTKLGDRIREPRCDTHAMERQLHEAAAKTEKIQAALQGLTRVAARCHDVLSRDLRPTRTTRGQLLVSLTAARKALEDTDE